MRYVYYPSRYVLLFAQGYRRLYHYSEQQRLGHNFDTVHRVTFQKDRQSTDNAKQARSRNHYCRGKATSRPITAYSECASVALVTQYAKHMRGTILSSVAYMAVPHFTTRPRKGHPKLLNMKCVF